MNFVPKDHVYVDKGQSTEDEGYLYMVGSTRAAITNMDGGRYIIAQSRLTKIEDDGK